MPIADRRLADQRGSYVALQIGDRVTDDASGSHRLPYAARAQIALHVGGLPTAGHQYDWGCSRRIHYFPGLTRPPMPGVLAYVVAAAHVASSAARLGSGAVAQHGREHSSSSAYTC